MEGGALGAADAVGLSPLFRFTTTWTGIHPGLLTRNEEAAGQLGGTAFILPLPSHPYVPAEGLFGNAPVPEGAAWPVVIRSPGRSPGARVLPAVFAPLVVRRYAHGEH